MKYVVCVCDGMSDYPLENLNRLTPLQFSRTPNMDEIATNGRCGLARTIPHGMVAGSDVANLSILGYNPKKYYCGRAPFEAASKGIDLKPGEVAFRCNLVTIAEDIMVDYSAGHISTIEAGALIELLNSNLGIEGIKFYPGVGYRHIAVINEKIIHKNLHQIKCVAPHDIVGESIEANLPVGPGAEFLYNVMETASRLLERHEINQIKLDLNECPANAIWFWGEGTKPQLPLFREKYKMTGAMVSAVDLLKGIAKLTGLDVINVPGATGYFDTNYEQKAKYAVDCLENHDFVFVHIEAPDEAGHSGALKEKIRAIERFDEDVVGYILDKLSRNDFLWRIMILPDHATPIAVKKHVGDPVPFAIMGYGIERDNVIEFNEKSVKKGAYGLQDGYNLMSIFTAQ